MAHVFRRLAPALVLFIGLSLQSVEAQRPSNTLYLGVRGGTTAYGGELDGTGTGPGGADEGTLRWLFRDFGFGVGGEIGYQFTRAFSFGVGYQYGTYPNLDREDIRSPVTLEVGQLHEETSVSQIQGLFRLNLIPAWKVTPFLQFGGVLALGQGDDPATGDGILGYGPHLGAGLDFLVGRQVSLYLEASGALIFPDDAVDGSDPSANALPWQDEVDYDALTLYGGGLRYFFRGPGAPVEAIAECREDARVGESVSFTASANPNATPPVSFVWNFGDGSTGAGATASHSYTAPGTYVVTVTASNPINSDSDSCQLTVVEVQDPPALAACRVSPSSADIGEEVTVSATVSGTEPIDVFVDFGDGNTASSLPATHRYESTGTYTVTITATNAHGSDTCTVTVNVGDAFCGEVTELNSVLFDFEMSSLSETARARLDENIELLRRCPNICVVINGYSDDQERAKLELSERRAGSVLTYYVENGIDESRIVARGLGEHPDANSKEDPGPGDRNARIADSIPVDCTRLGDFN